MRNNLMEFEWDFDLEQQYEDRHGYPENQYQDIDDEQEDYGDYDHTDEDEDGDY